MKFLKHTSLIILTFLLSLTLMNFSTMKSDLFEMTKNLELFTNIFRELEAHYVDEISPDKLVTTGIDAMLNSLDPYTNFISESDMSSYRLQTTGKYGGVGALIRKNEEYVIIAEPYEGFPAHKVDLRAGDKLLKIDGKSVKGKNTNDISKLLKGSPNTKVDIVVERLGESKPLTKTIEREEIKIESVPYYGMLNDKTGYITLTSFTENCSEDVGNALQELKEKHNIESVVLDLRSNPGGLLTEAINVANIFLPRGEMIVSTKGRDYKEKKDYKSKQKPIDTEIPLAILIDRGSASASEIVAGVMQDYDRAIVIGKRSFGKGLVQTTKNVAFNNKVKMTTAKYYLPSDRCIQAINYSGKYGDNPEKVPDSLRTAFKTSTGRIVYDAGGIDPDIETKNQEYSNIAISLIQKQLVFDYATKYRQENESIPMPDKFELTDQDFDKFVAFLANKKYDYETSSERLLEKLKENAEKENYLTAIESELTDLKNKIKHDKKQDLQKFKSELKQLLEYEIVMRYHFQKGEIQEALEDDKSVKEALSVLGSNTKYRQLLKK
ncbi:MAG: S41 family peptidase [Chitinophagales bacterium]